MPDPTADTSWLTTWLVPLMGGATVAGGSIVAGWRWLMTRMRADTAEARAERKAAVAEAAENEIIKTLREQLAEERRQRSEDVASLKAQIAECRGEIGELRGQLRGAFEARVQAMQEAAQVREQNAQLETKINLQHATIEAQQAKITTLTQAYKGLSEWVGRLDLSESERSSGPYRDAAAWLGQNRDRLAGAA